LICHFDFLSLIFDFSSAFELYLPLASPHHSGGLPAHNHKRRMLTKRIARILTAESAAGGRLTYEKELLVSRKNSHFYKTNHPGFPATVAHTTSVKWDILER